MKLPKVRTENLLEQNLEKEMLLYDLTINKAFNLNDTSTIVYKACDGITSFEELKRKHKFTDDLIYLALDELKRNNLLADEFHSSFDAADRRQIIKKVGLASIAALPLIVGLTAPRAARAASSGGSLGCSSNVCYPAGNSLCDACYVPGSGVFTQATEYGSTNGSCSNEVGTIFQNCAENRFTPNDTKFSGVLD